MWSLRSKNGNTVLYIKFNHMSTVGRNFGDIVFPNDKSISRKHATICVSSDKVTVEDHKSTYGTYINDGIAKGNRINPGVKVTVNGNDTIKFGMLDNEWIFQKEKYVTCLSTFKEAAALAGLRAQLEELGVAVCKEWRDECTHLTMPGITLTLKVLQALVHGRPIVGPAFWAELLRCRVSGEAPPTTASFLPPLCEAHLAPQADFGVRDERKCIFRGKLFIFFTRQQLNMYSDVIAAAGGESCYLKERRMTNAQLCAASSVVVQYSPSRNTQDSQEASARIDTIARYMASKKCRIVPESEIGLAILYVSIEQCCNPRFNFSSVFDEKRDVSPSRDARVLAAETEEVEGDILSGSSVPSTCVQETLRSLISPTSISSKDSSQLLDKSLMSARAFNKKVKATSPNPEEPARKKRNNNDEIKTEEISECPTPRQDMLFQFIEEEPKASTSAAPERLQLTIQSSKRKHTASPCKEDNLFNFVPEEDESRKSMCLNLSPLKKSNPDKVVTELNLGKSAKRKYDNLDSVDGNLRSKLRNTGSSTSISSGEGSRASNKSELGAAQWLNKKSFMVTDSTVKKEDVSSSTSSETSAESDIMTKFKELDIKPAIVEVNNTLIARDVTGNAELRCEFPPSTLYLDSKKNYKMFSKVKPLKPHSEIVSSNMFVVYESKTNQDLNKFMNTSSDEEDKNEGIDSIMNVGKRKSVYKGKSRRL